MVVWLYRGVQAVVTPLACVLADVRTATLSIVLQRPGTHHTSTHFVTTLTPGRHNWPDWVYR